MQQSSSDYSQADSQFNGDGLLPVCFLYETSVISVVVTIEVVLLLMVELEDLGARSVLIVPQVVTRHRERIQPIFYRLL